MVTATLMDQHGSSLSLPAHVAPAHLWVQGVKLWACGSRATLELWFQYDKCCDSNSVTHLSQAIISFHFLYIPFSATNMNAVIKNGILKAFFFF